MLGIAVADALRDAICAELLIHLRGRRTVAGAWPIGRHAATSDFKMSNRVERSGSAGLVVASAMVHCVAFVVLRRVMVVQSGGISIRRVMLRPCDTNSFAFPLICCVGFAVGHTKRGTVWGSVGSLPAC